EIAELNPTWSPDGRFLAYEVKPKTSAVYEIDVYDMVLREVKHLTTNTPQDKRNVNPIWSKDGKYIVYTQEQAKGTDSNIFIADVDGNEDIHLYDLATGKSTALAIPKGVNEPAGDHSAFSPDGSRLLYYHNGPTAPSDLWIYPLASGKSQQITHSLVGGV